MYAKIENNNVVKYPVNENEIRAAFPHVSFSQPLYPLEPYVIVNDVEKPSITSAQKLEETTPVFIGGQWYKKWNVIDLSDTVYQSLLKDKKDSKLSELAATRWQYLHEGLLTYKGKQYKTDEASRIQYNIAAINQTTATWKVANGDFVILDELEIQELNVMVWDFVQRTFAKEKTVTDLITACNTIEELNGIDPSIYFE